MDYYGLLHVITVDDDTDADELAEAQVIYGDFRSSPVICSQVPVQNDGNQCHKEVLEAFCHRHSPSFSICMLYEWKINACIFHYWELTQSCSHVQSCIFLEPPWLVLNGFEGSDLQ